MFPACVGMMSCRHVPKHICEEFILLNVSVNEKKESSHPHHGFYQVTGQRKMHDILCSLRSTILGCSQLRRVLNIDTLIVPALKLLKKIVSAQIAVEKKWLRANKSSKGSANYLIHKSRRRDT